MSIKWLLFLVGKIWPINNIDGLVCQIMRVIGYEFETVVMFSLLVLLLCSNIWCLLLYRKTTAKISALEQATSHLALALETLNVDQATDSDEEIRNRRALIGAIAGGSLGAIWGPVGVIAGSGMGSGIGNLAPEALDKAKAVFAKVGLGAEASEQPKKKTILGRLPFIGSRNK